MNKIINKGLLNHKICIGNYKNFFVFAEIKKNKLYNLNLYKLDSIYGNIYSGRIKDVLRKINSLFVEIGRERPALLNLTSKDKNHYKAGDKILVQVVRDEEGEKGAKLTQKIRYILPFGTVYFSIKLTFPSLFDYSLFETSKVDSSNKQFIQIASLFEARIKEINKLLPPYMNNKITLNNFVIRFNKIFYNFKHDKVIGLLDKYLDWLILILKNHFKAKTPGLIFTQKNIIERAILENFPVVKFTPITLCLTSREHKDIVQDVLKKFGYRLKINYLIDEEMFFSQGVISEIRKLKKDKLWLPSGGWVIIEKTSVGIVIDVNSGKNVKSLDKVNEEALKEIARYIRLRNLGGIIIIDLINTPRFEKKKEKILDLVKKLFLEDKYNPRVFGFSALGLLEIARKKETEEFNLNIF